MKFLHHTRRQQDMNRGQGLKDVGFWFDPNNAPQVLPEGRWSKILVGLLAAVNQRSLLNPRDLVDPTWSSEQRARVIQYLKSGPGVQVVERYLGDSWCRFGCRHAEMGCADMSDGVYLWPEGYTHYLEVHDVKPPKEFIEHALMRLKKEEVR